MRKHSGGEVFRITAARQGLEADVRARQRRYVISMSVRTVSVILAAVLWNVERHVAIVALVLGAVLPYISVVIANAGRENAPSLPSSLIMAPTRPMIEPPQRDGGSAESVPEDVADTGDNAAEASTGVAGDRRDRSGDEVPDQS
ncbi:DUF3099 domain-containing protein [Streptomyces sp. PSKA54]|uniref:DUF3099 domain-containing protein n=1 Tax=Streptomyces himalayensis subsp. aureolus TaxID=2758039 RepID=A0A7W2CVP7_9ACTN|nr:DUF3099 domain-containing protein [Streptomyces himalayensis]MBA4859811.1 DUF3099 domain-containing protein [Streptomyces himalayensis subsp. aureolus]